MFNGRGDLSAIDHDDLPEKLQAMSPEARKTLIQSNADLRLELNSEIKTLSGKRSAFIDKKFAESGDAKKSLDQQIHGAIREQAAAKGLHYATGAISY